jgi:hypothetical protein
LLETVTSTAFILKSTLLNPTDSGIVLSINQSRSFLEWSEIDLEWLLSLGNLLHMMGEKGGKTYGKFTEILLEYTEGCQTYSDCNQFLQ